MGDPYPNESPAAKRMQTFYEVLTQRGHNVTVMAPSYGKVNPEEPDVVYCPTIKIRKKTTILRMLNQLSFAFSSLLSCKKAGKADIVLTTSPPVLISMSGWLIAKIKNAKLVYDLRDIWPDVALEMGSFSEKSLYNRVFSYIRNFMLKHSELITTVSPSKVKKLQKYAPENKIAFITNGLDEHFLENKYQSEISEKYGLNSGFNCVYIGNLGLAQGLMQLMNLAERARDHGINARFILFGSGVEEDFLRKYADNRALNNVTFVGRIPNSEMFTVLKAAQLSFVSLVNDKMKDSVPTKMFEALGAGCPVLLAASGDSADILNSSKLGIAVSPNDADALWDAFLEIYSHPEKYTKNKEHAVSLIKNEYSRQKAALTLESYFLKISQSLK